jgi:hypothetical protein
LPPQFGLNLPRLERFLEMLPRDLQHAVELNAQELQRLVERVPKGGRAG